MRGFFFQSVIFVQLIAFTLQAEARLCAGDENFHA